MSRYVIGIDPGRSGSFCVRDISGEFIELYEMPVVDTEIDIPGIRDLIRKLVEQIGSMDGEIKVYLEKSQSMPGNAAQAMLRYGVGAGAIEGILCSYYIPYVLVHPKTWTKVVHEGIGDYVNSKNKSLIAAKRLFPKISFFRNERCKKEDEGFIDAALIAEYGARKERGTA